MKPIDRDAGEQVGVDDSHEESKQFEHLHYLQLLSLDLGLLSDNFLSTLLQLSDSPLAFRLVRSPAVGRRFPIEDPDFIVKHRQLVAQCELSVRRFGRFVQESLSIPATADDIAKSTFFSLHFREHFAMSQNRLIDLGDRRVPLLDELASLGIRLIGCRDFREALFPLFEELYGFLQVIERSA